MEGTEGKNNTYKTERLTFHKSERLRHHSLVDSLYRNGKTIYEFPFRLTWKSLNQESLEAMFRNKVPDGIGRLQMMVTVPKKKRRHAVDRVQMRRRIREAYRLNRVSFRKKLEEEPDIRTLSLSLVYIHDKNLPYKNIEEKIRIVLDKLGKKTGRE